MHTNESILRLFRVVYRSSVAVWVCTITLAIMTLGGQRFLPSLFVAFLSLSVGLPICRWIGYWAQRIALAAEKAAANAPPPVTRQPPAPGNPPLANPNNPVPQNRPGGWD
jgi:hypothetical protein